MDRLAERSLEPLNTLLKFHLPFHLTFSRPLVRRCIARDTFHYLTKAGSCKEVLGFWNNNSRAPMLLPPGFWDYRILLGTWLRLVQCWRSNQLSWRKEWEWTEVFSRGRKTKGMCLLAASCHFVGWTWWHFYSAMVSLISVSLNVSSPSLPNYRRN